MNKTENRINKPIFFTEYQSFPQYRESTKKFTNISRIFGDFDLVIPRSEETSHEEITVVVDLDDKYYQVSPDGNGGLQVCVITFDHSKFLHYMSKCPSCIANENGKYPQLNGEDSNV